MPSEPFESTRWSLVAAAGGDRGSGRAREALEALCSAYWYPIYAFIRRRGHDAEAAADLAQGFFAALLESDAFFGLDPAKGKFRAFLLASCQHFLAHERDRANALKRGGGRTIASLDDAEGRYRREPSHDLTPEALFDRRYALALLDATLDELRADFARRGQADHFDALKPTLTGDARNVPYREIADRLGTTEGAVQVAVHRLRKRYREALRDRIAQTVAGPSEIDDEIRDLFAALAR